jgi:hypothetical protein|tara:strand:- start:6084 stop:6659 length:576 start_codon:yes stop_codon:yes gene_type:complete
MEENYKDYDQEGLKFLSTNGRPIPGESLTNSPDTPYPWEQPTQFTELEPAIDALFIELTEPEAYHSLLNLIENEVPIGDVTQIVLTDGFQKGMWNPDLLMLLIEPTMYMIMALAEKAGMMDNVIYQGEEEDVEDQDEQLSSIEKAIDIAQDKIVPKARAGVLPKNIEEKIEEMTPPREPSLLEKPELQEDI